MASTLPNSVLVQEFTIADSINPTGAALSAAFNVAYPIPITDTTHDYYANSEMYAVIDRVTTDTLAAGAIDADNKRWTLTVAGSSAVGTWGASIMLPTVIMVNDGLTRHTRNFESGFFIYDIPNLSTVPCPSIYLTFAPGATVVNLTTGAFRINGRLFRIS